ncbi:MAG: phenylalanine--tRNA ligase subunit alpha [Candidatus Hydrothermarchaeota archaeon]
MEELHSHERKVLMALSKLREATQEALASETGLDYNSVGRAIYWLMPKGLITVEEVTEGLIDLGEEGRVYTREGLPERRALALAMERGELRIENLMELLGEERAKIALGWLRRKGLARIEMGRIVPTELGRGGSKSPDEELLELLSAGPLVVGDLEPRLLEGLKLLKERQDVIRIEERARKTVAMTEAGQKLAEKGLEVAEGEATQLTHEHLKAGSWKGLRYRAYDVQAFAPEALPAKLHPLGRMVQEIRRIFLQMGFQEIKGPLVESGFWNFDALFVPQDHPAREMQDTFYLSRPSRGKLPEGELVRAVASAHENGGGTGSRGWNYRWDPKAAEALLLRTHTTAATIRYLAAHKEPPIKVFSIGRVFRNEKITFKHLPEFHQVEGIVMGDANFSNLLGILREYYAKMGFEKVRFRPSFFPYTEPSLEVEVFYPERGGWLELGGAGIFRPEVTEPLGIKHPVLAWGLGLERLAMLRLGLEDIRALYMSDIDWLRRVPCR